MLISREQRKKEKNKYRPSKQQCTATEVPQSSTNGLYTEMQHNDNPLVVRLLPAEEKHCKTCKVDFCHRQRHIPFDLTRKAGIFPQMKIGITNVRQIKRENDFTTQT